MAEQEHTDLERLQKRKRQEAALRKQMQYINSLSPEDREKIYAKKHRPAEHIEPKTFKEKWANYWYHYKWLTFGCVAAVLIGGFFVYDMVTKEKYDMSIMMITKDYYDSESVGAYIDKTAQYCPDTDENEEQNISFMAIQMDRENSEQADPNFYMAQFVKMTSSISEGMDAVYLMDQDNYDFLTQEEGDVKFVDLSQFSDNENVEGDKYYIKNDALLGDVDAGNDLFLVLRAPDDMPNIDKDDVKELYVTSKEYLINLMNQTPVEK